MKITQWVLIVCCLVGCLNAGDEESPSAPIFIKQPNSQLVIEGDPASFSVLVESDGPLSFQWYRFSFDPTDDYAPEPVGDMPVSMYVIESVVLEDDWTGYYCIVSGPGGDARSKSVALRVIPLCPTGE